MTNSVLLETLHRAIISILGVFGAYQFNANSSRALSATGIDPAAPARITLENLGVRPGYVMLVIEDTDIYQAELTAN